MSKRRNKSRLTRTDVNTICQMQQKIDAYESYIFALVRHSSAKFDTKKYVVFEMGTDMDGWIHQIWRNIDEMKQQLEELKKNESEGD